MSSLIEQAARRLQQLREAGVDMDVVAPPPPSVVEEPPPPTPAPATRQSRHVELDLSRLAASRFVVPNAPRSRLADEFRVVKRPLIRNASGKGASLSHANLVMVTSALAGEGKSFTSINLAMSIAAELDHTVLLVDADVARPSLPSTLGIEPGPGLLDVLEGRAELSDVLLRTNVEKLSLLQSGTPHPKATELLASEAMRRFLDDIATRYADRIVIFDSPPLLLTTEARVLASHMGQIVLVVQAGRTLQSAVQAALATIETCPVKFPLLNQARNAPADAYGYGYGYGYGHDYGYGQGYAQGDARPEATPS